MLEAIGVDEKSNQVHRVNIHSDPNLGTPKEATVALAVALVSLVIAIALFVVSGRKKKQAMENIEPQTTIESFNR